MIKVSLKTKKNKKLPKGVTEEFVDKVMSLDNEGKKALIVELQKHISEAKTFLKTNEKIVQMREELKELEGPARETISHMNNRTKYLIDELKKSGAI